MLARIQFCLVDFAQLTVGSVRFLAVRAERNGMHACSSFGVACVAFVDCSRVCTCTDFANLCVGAPAFRVSKSLALLALGCRRCGVQLLRPYANPEYVEPVPDRLLSLSFGSEGNADCAGLLLLSSVGFSQPVRVADHLEALVVDLNLFLDELQTLVG